MPAPARRSSRPRWRPGLAVAAAAAATADPASKVLLRADKISTTRKTSVVIGRRQCRDRLRGPHPAGPAGSPTTRTRIPSPPKAISACWRRTATSPSPIMVVLTQGMRDGVLDGFQALDRQERAAGRPARGAQERRDHLRHARSLHALQDLQQTRPAHAHLGSEGGPHRLRRKGTPHLLPRRRCSSCSACRCSTRRSSAMPIRR